MSNRTKIGIILLLSVLLIINISIVMAEEKEDALSSTNMVAETISKVSIEVKKQVISPVTELGVKVQESLEEPEIIEEIEDVLEEEVLEEPQIFFGEAELVYEEVPAVSFENDYQSYAYSFFSSYGWSDYDFECLVNLWNRESRWDPLAHNSSSGAHGIPQSLPASKMASHGDDYWDNGYTQIRWGLDYIAGRYGTPANAWYHSECHGWY